MFLANNRAHQEPLAPRNLDGAAFGALTDGPSLARPGGVHPHVSGLFKQKCAAMVALHGNGAVNVIDRVLSQRQDTP